MKALYFFISLQAGLSIFFLLIPNKAVKSLVERKATLEGFINEHHVETYVIALEKFISLGSSFGVITLSIAIIQLVLLLMYSAGRAHSENNSTSNYNYFWEFISRL